MGTLVNAGIELTVGYSFIITDDGRFIRKSTGGICKYFTNGRIHNLHLPSC